jgi:hypothetical protein
MGINTQNMLWSARRLLIYHLLSDLNKSRQYVMIIDVT